ncbi:MAG: nitrilase-related carbon-nitrogen hydrolase [Syntrophobacteraceae bacterium]
MVAITVAAALSGALAWSGSMWTIPASLLFPCLWVGAKNRRNAALTALAYYGTASRGVAIGASTYFHSLFVVGILVWLAGTLIISLPWTLLWAPGFTARMLLASVAILVTALPPFGIVGWGSPITAAGVLFPGWKWAGLFATFVFMMILSAIGIKKSFWQACLWQAAVVGLAVLAVAVLFPKLPTAPPGWCGYDTHYPDETGQPDYLKDYARLTALTAVSQSLARLPGSVVVFPESAGGSWGAAGRMVWEKTRKVISGIVLFGAEVLRGSGKYDNDLVSLKSSGDRVLYRQRMPVPVTMWRPWSESSGANAYWFREATFRCAGLRAAALICYEQFLVWPVLESMWERPQVLIAIGNDWWAKNTNLSRIQRAASLSWARLFGVRLVTAVNS